MHGLYKSRKKMLASTLHLTTTPADHHHNPQPGETAVTAQRNTTTPNTGNGRPLRTQQCANISLARTRKLEPCPVPLQTKQATTTPETGWSVLPPKPSTAGHQDDDPSPTENIFGDPR